MAQVNVMCVSHVGGQGKTTVTQLIHLFGARAGLELGLVSADFIDATGRSKLGKLFPQKTVELGVGASLTAARQENNPNAPLRYWDRLGGLLLRDSHVIDLGVNVYGDVVTWALDRHLASLMERKGRSKLDLVCVVRPEGHAYDNIHHLIADTLERRPFLLNAIYVVKNAAGGPFPDGEVEKRLSFKNAPIRFVELPRCYSEIWVAMERKRVSIQSVLSEENDEDLAGRLDVDLFTAIAGASELRDWVDQAELAFRRAGLFSEADSRPPVAA
jgi:hypothetical protein